MKLDFSATVTVTSNDTFTIGDTAVGQIVLDGDSSDFAIEINGEEYSWLDGNLVESDDYTYYDSCITSRDLCEFVVAPQAFWRVDQPSESISYFEESYIRLIVDWPDTNASLEFTSIQPHAMHHVVPEPTTNALFVIAGIITILWRNLHRRAESF